VYISFYMHRYRSFSAAVFVVVVCALVGGLFGRSAVVAQDQVPGQYEVFSKALRAVEDVYVGETEADRLVYSAITGMLQTLDPHSSFMDPRSYAQMRERQEGRYYGLGISIQVIDGDITVFTVFEGSPAYESGIRRGDVIAKIEGEETKGWPVDQAVGKLRGPKGTTIGISIRRTGYEKLIDLQVRRDEVRMPSVTAAVLLDASTGYIKIGDQGFGENTDQELGRALRDLTQKGMKQLVLDLRDNPGGALDQAIKVSNRFLRKGELIVYTRGRAANSDQDYHATENSDYLNVPMITLVNRNSASASEIVSGALQDHDRSLIVGETTFGKALVQSVYKVQQAGAAITTARYLTPSGRLIQRPWDGTFDEYMTYRYREQDANKPHRAEDLKLTAGGRKVYSGGGVEPDRRFDGPVEGFKPTRFMRSVYARSLFDVYARRFARRGDTRIAPSGSGPARDLPPDYEVTDAMVAEFKELAQKTPVKWDEAAWQSDIEFVKAMIGKEIDVDLFGVAVAYRNVARRDPQLQYALTLFPEAQQLLELNRTRRPQSTRVSR
jgi:carboxyl-terminal processing protease